MNDTESADREPKEPGSLTVRGPAVSVRGPLIVHGAGGHGRAVAEAAALAGAGVLGFLDDHDAEVPGHRVWTDAAELPAGVPVHVAIGDPAARSAALLRHLADRRPLATVIHPAASVSPSASLDRGVYAGPLAVVGAGCFVSHGAILNSGSILEHDGSVGPFSHLGPGAIAGGGVTIDDHVQIGLGVRILPSLRIEHHAVIGAGAIVLRDVKPGETVVGIVR